MHDKSIKKFGPYDETLRPDVWAAFEKTADACETLALNHRQKLTIH